MPQDDKNNRQQGAVRPHRTGELFTIDEALTKSIGQFGRGQQILWFVASAAWIPAAIQTLVMVFLVIDPIKEKEWECSSPINSTTCLNLYDNPLDLSAKDITQELCNDSRSVDWQWKDKDFSVVSTYDIHCERWLAPFSNAGFFFGFLIGAGVWGWYADTFGRKGGILVVLVLSGLLGCVNSAAWSFWSYMLFRTFVGFAVAGVGLICFVLATEPLGAYWRGFAGLLSQCFFPVGEMILALMAWLIQDWRLLNIVASLSTILYLLFIPFLLESARWLLVQGKKDKALSTLKRIATMNRTQMPEGDLVAPPSNPLVTQQGTLKDVFMNNVLRKRILSLMYGWCAVSAMYYGIQLSLDSLGGNRYLNIFLMGLVELLSYVLGAAVVEVLGRSPLVVWGIFLGGVSSIITGSVPPGGVRIVFSLIGKFCASISFNTMFIYTVELFPTVVRSKSLGSCSLSARVGGIVAPGIVALGDVWGDFMTFFVFGVMSILAGVWLAFLPETLGCPLMETFSDISTGPSKLNKYSCLGLKGVKPRKQPFISFEQEQELDTIFADEEQNSVETTS